MLEPIFLTRNQVLRMHGEQIATFGGDPAGLTDRGKDLLDSALAQPEASWGGEWLNSFPFGMAAAYLHSICQNHPFEDGNKRVALDACLTFLLLNGYECSADTDSLTLFIVEVASSKHRKDEVETWLEANCEALD
jgi:death-on-curing protein